jgi:hypothetical protein
MGILEILITLIIASGASYQAGKAGQRAEAVDQQKICFDEAYGERENGCYRVIPPSETAAYLEATAMKKAPKKARKVTLK